MSMEATSLVVSALPSSVEQWDKLVLGPTEQWTFLVVAASVIHTFLYEHPYRNHAPVNGKAVSDHLGPVLPSVKSYLDHHSWRQDAEMSGFVLRGLCEVDCGLGLNGDDPASNHPCFLAALLRLSQCECTASLITPGLVQTLQEAYSILHHHRLEHIVLLRGAIHDKLVLLEQTIQALDLPPLPD